MSDTFTLAELRYSIEAAAEHLMRLHGRMPDDCPPMAALHLGQAHGLLMRALAQIRLKEKGHLP